jgi:hypothetical protein
MVRLRKRGTLRGITLIPYDAVLQYVEKQAIPSPCANAKFKPDRSLAALGRDEGREAGGRR